MIKVKNPDHTQFDSGIAAGALKCGMLVVYDSLDDMGNMKFRKATTGDENKSASEFRVVAQEQVMNEGGTPAYEDIADGANVLVLGRSGWIIEDDKLATLSDGDFAGASAGDSLVLNSDGYLTTVGAAKAVASSPVIAKFVGYENGIVTYVLV